MRDEEIVEGVDEPARAVARSREAAPVREEDPRVGSPDAGELRGDRQGVADVLGQKGAALFASCGDQPPAGKSSQRELPRHRRHVVRVRAAMLGDPWAVVLDEE